MEIIPAIDIRDGRVVRLRQGDYAQETVYSLDPVAMALRWEQEGASRLHVVDLDGAQTGAPVNLKAVEAIASQVRTPFQLGGGIRTLEAAGRLLKLGAQRVVVGTAAVEDPRLVTGILERFGPQALVVAVDARGGKVAVRGWNETTAVKAASLVGRMRKLGVRRLLFTDINRDGTLTEPNFQSIAQVVRVAGVPVLASGGIASTEHLVRLKALGVEGAIVGSALYTGAIGLRQAIEAVGG